MNPTMQRSEALERANEIRTQRADLKRAVKAGETTITELLQAPIPSWLRSEPIGRLLKCIPKCGEKRAGKILRSVPVDYWRTVGNLTPREKAGLVLRLRERSFDA